MKVLRISQQIYPEVVGGGAYHAHALSRDQVAMGHDVTVLSILPDLDRPVESFRDGYRIVQYPASGTLLGNDVSVGAGRYVRRARREYDVVHAHAHFYFASNVAAVCAQFDEVPLVLTNHALISQSVPRAVARIHLKTVGRFTFDSADLVFCYTDQERTQLRRLASNPAIEVVSNGIDHRRFSPDGRASPRIDSETVSILFVGRFVDGKRPQDAIDAFDAVRERGIDAKLYLCGDGPMREALVERVERRGLSDDVEFLGLVDYDEMPAVFRAADVFVLPSRSEGFPRTVMEALSTETPVVASDLEQVGAVVRRAGRTIDPGDVAALADHLAELCTDGALRRRLGQAGRAVVVEDGLTWEETARRTTKLTERVLK